MSLLFKGFFLSVATALSVYIIITFAEFFGRFSSTVRLALLLSFISVVGYLFYRHLYFPILSILGIKKMLTDEKAAQNIGAYYPQIADKLLNTLQLQKQSHQNDLVLAAFKQKGQEFIQYNFEEAISLQKNRKYILFFSAVLAIILSIYYLVPSFFRDSTTRIYHFNEEFQPSSPYQFNLVNFKNYALRGEDVKLNLQVDGPYLPSSVEINIGGNVYPIQKNSNDYSFIIKNIQNSTEFNFVIGTFESELYQIKVLSQPSLSQLSCHITYPSYLNKRPQDIANTGNLIVPEGALVQWNALTKPTDVLNVYFNNQKEDIKKTGAIYVFSKKILASANYQIQVHHNEFHKVADSVTYIINCIKDEYPGIKASPLIDSSAYNNINIVGTIEDDYGISSLHLIYKKTNSQGMAAKERKIVIPYDKAYKNQKFYFSWNIDSLVSEGSQLEYYLLVADNDGVNGAKRTKSLLFKFEKPSNKTIKEQVEAASQKSISNIKSIQSQSERAENKLNSLEEKLKAKTSLSWQDKKEISTLIKENKDHESQINDLKQQMQELSKTKNEVSEPNNELKQKLENLDELMNELLDEETKKMYEKLEQLLNEQANKNEIDKLIKNLAMKEQNFNNEVSKLLEMFKEIQLDEKINDAIKDLNQLADKQLQQAEKANSDNAEKNNTKLTKDQQSLNSEFEKLKEELKEIQKLNSDLEDKKPLDSKEESAKQISQHQQKAQQSLENKKNKQSSDEGKKAGESMQKMANEMEAAQQSSQEQQQEENIKDLRMILENLVQLSFDQEEILHGFKKVSNVNPQYIELSQKQLKIKSDSKIVEDSLLALSKRVFEMKAFVTRELIAMSGKIDESIEEIKARRIDQAVTKQQYAMSSMNNLALMLDDLLKQMQQQMAESQKSQGSKSCSKPGKKPGKNPGLSEMQKQLGKQMQELIGKGNMPGKQMSEALAKMAAQQEYIRKAIQQLEKNQKGGRKPGSALDNLAKEMEKNEEDWVNKKFNQDQLKRQQEILTRLLESEKAQKERDLEQTRVAEQAKNSLKNTPPKSIQDLINKKQSETELLRTLPPSLNNFYKKESSLYFDIIQ